MKDPDVQLVRFFHAVVEQEIEQNTSTVHKQSLKRVKSLHGHETFKRTKSKTNSTSSAARCAYVYHYGPCFTSTLTAHFRSLLAENSFFLQSIVHRGTFRICCISTGLAMEFVAMVRALEEVLRSHRFVDDGQLKIEVVVISFDSDCSGTVRKMVDDLPQILDISKWKLDLRFLSLDLTRPLTDDAKEAVHQSDFVTMVHLLSSIHQNGNSLQTLQDILPFVRESAVLFFLDFPDFHLCDALRGIVSSSERMKEIYGPLSYDIHRISLMCRKECLRLYSKYYGWRHCALESINYVCAWYKRTDHRS